MATRMKLMPPTRADGQEPLRYSCECGDENIHDPFMHSRIKHREKNVIMDTTSIANYKPYYSKESYSDAGS